MIPEFHPAAEQELAAAIKAVEGISTGLGVGLSAEAKRVIDLLCYLPRIGKPLDQDYRRFPLTQFPYGLIYRINGGRLQIIAVAHRRQRPGYWRKRV